MQIRNTFTKVTFPLGSDELVTIVIHYKINNKKLQYSINLKKLEFVLKMV